MKRKNPLLLLTLGIFSICNSSISAQNTAKEKDDAFSFEASYVGDLINNFSGGIKTGLSYLGMANLHVGFDTEKAGLWKGGELHLNAANTHGATPSADMLGDMQVISNIEAGDHTFLQELWYKQKLGKVELTLGLQDLNVEFANSEYGSLFLNSSFGILPVISTNFSAPIFPLTTLGVTAKWGLSDKFALLGAVYDGNPTDFEFNPYNIKWRLSSGDGVLAITELQYCTTVNSQPGIYKLGAYSHNHRLRNVGETDSPNYNLVGFYAYGDQKVWEKNHQSIGLFAQLGYSPSDVSINNTYVGLGANYTGLFTRKGDDALGLAFAHQHFTNELKSETTVELTYRCQLTEKIFIQPDIQYIINPAGTGVTLDNCFTGNVRFGLNF
ncbi:carbohydrate porin [Bacteroides sedimenti]|uniref:Porin n=1 Tax=Bacteroides sedimenti TaxID=2136147 RepID=A0ABM8IG22_9BACE